MSRPNGKPYPWSLGALVVFALVATSLAMAQGKGVIFVKENAVGIGRGFDAAPPDASLHVRQSDGTAKILVEETLPGDRDLLVLSNNGAVRSLLTNTATGVTWVNEIDLDGNFAWSRADSGLTEWKFLPDGSVSYRDGVMTLSNTGDLVIKSLTETSDVHAKRDIVPVDPQAVLQELLEVPISTWRFDTDAGEIRHMGPMAQDFRAGFGLGRDERHIGTLDANGVALAAIQGVHAQLEDKEAQLEALEERNAALETRLTALERLMALRLPSGQNR